MYQEEQYGAARDGWYYSIRKLKDEDGGRVNRFSIRHIGTFTLLSLSQPKQAHLIGIFTATATGGIGKCVWLVCTYLCASF